MGMMLFEIVTSRRLLHCTIYIMILITPIILNYELATSRGYFYGISSFIIMLILLMAFKNIKFNNWLLLLGSSSYSLYLTHAYIIQALDKLLKLFSVKNIYSQFLTSIFCYAICVLLSIIMHKKLESPINNYIRKKTLRK
ncbi:hypothetical protein Xbed_02119 [Xenorhabdus beddingii]|uniref:Uncharacterized protein n=1 Tax=Xenorhabdus beddingii TaxID=40578 RepID=A0A1Y2SKY2_9GAMM|nr:hypothetical protein Xbed_02119 [Xenorhabdus beddingii]